MFCNDCGNELLSNSRFCSACGADTNSPTSSSSPSAALGKFLANLIDGKIANKVYAVSTIDSARLNNVKNTYVTLSGDDEQVVVLYDDTAFGSAKEGFVLTNKRFISNMRDKFGGNFRVIEMPIASIKSFKIEAKKMSSDVVVNGDLVGNITQLSSGEVERVNSQLALVFTDPAAFSNVSIADQTNLSSVHASSTVSPTALAEAKADKGGNLFQKVAGIAIAIAAGWWMFGPGGASGGYADIYGAEKIIRETLISPSSYNQLESRVLWKGTDSEGNDAVMVLLDYEATNRVGGAIRDCQVVSYTRKDENLSWKPGHGLQSCPSGFLPEDEAIKLYKETNFGV